MALNRYLELAVKGGLWLTLFLPLVVSRQMFFPFITPKNFLFRVIVEVTFLLWMVLLLRDRSYLPKKSWILIFVAATLGVLTLATLFGQDIYRSFWSNYERMEGLISHFHFFAYFLILASVMRSEKDWWRFFHLSLLVSVLVGFYAVFQLLGKFEIHQGGVRIDATFGNATYLAVYLLFHLFFILYYFLKTTSGFWRALYLLLFLFELFLLYETATRGAILGFLGGLMLFSLLLGFLSAERKHRMVGGVALGLVLLAVSGFYLVRDSTFVDTSPTLSRFRNISLADDTTQSRFIIWGMALQGVKEHPILGWGPENFNLVFGKYFDPRLWKQEPWFDRSHNAVFDWLSSGGIPGLISYLGIFAAALFGLWKNWRQRKISPAEISVFAGLLGGYFFQNLFVFDQLTSYLLFLGTLAYLDSSSSLNEPQGKSRVPFAPPGAQNVWAAAFCIVVVFALYFINLKPYRENLTLLAALQEAGNGRIPQAHEKFRKALSFRSFGDRETREQFAHFATLIAPKEDVPVETRLAVLNEAVSELKLQIDSSPQDPRNYLFLASVYQTIGRVREAREAFEKAAELSPKKQQILLALAQAYFQEKNFEKAVVTASRAASLEPAYTEGRFDFVTIAIASSYDELAVEEILALETIGAANPTAYKRWASLWAQERKYERAGELYKKALRQVPEDIQLRVSLAATYLELGEPTLAVEELKEAIRRDPKFREQGEFLIQEILAGRKPQ